MTTPAATSKKPSDLISRMMTAALLIPLIYLIIKGGWLAMMIVLVAGTVMVFEVLSIIKQPALSPRGLVLFAAMILPALIAAAMPLLVSTYGLFILCVAVAALYTYGHDWTTRSVMIALNLCLFSIITVLVREDGHLWLVFAVVTIIAADSMAYFGGRMIGGPKLAEKISPSKTWSGALCGVSAGAIAGSTMGMIFGFDPTIAGVLGLFIADLSIGGDLLESWFKRCYDVKDSGRILPGHGGFLDRFDGYLLALPFLAVVLAMGVV